MQKYENITTNTKSFPEIWVTLSETEKDDLCIKLYQKKCCRSRQAIRYWASGSRKPSSPLVRSAIADVVSKQVGARCLAETLFPES